MVTGFEQGMYRDIGSIAESLRSIAQAPEPEPREVVVEANLAEGQVIAAKLESIDAHLVELVDDRLPDLVEALQAIAHQLEARLG